MYKSIDEVEPSMPLSLLVSSSFRLFYTFDLGTTLEKSKRSDIDGLRLMYDGAPRRR